MGRFRIRADRHAEFEALLYNLEKHRQPDKKTWAKISHRRLVNGSIIKPKFYKPLVSTALIAQETTLENFVSKFFETEAEMLQEWERNYHAVAERLSEINKEIRQERGAFPHFYQNALVPQNDPAFETRLFALANQILDVHKYVYWRKDVLSEKHYHHLMADVEFVYDNSPVVRTLYHERQVMKPIFDELVAFKKMMGHEPPAVPTPQGLRPQPFLLDPEQRKLYERIRSAFTKADEMLEENYHLYPYFYENEPLPDRQAIQKKLNKGGLPDEKFREYQQELKDRNRVKSIAIMAADIHMTVVEYRDFLSPMQYERLLEMVEVVYDGCQEVRRIYRTYPYAKSAHEAILELKNKTGRRDLGAEEG